MPSPLTGSYTPNFDLYVLALDDELDDALLATGQNFEKLEDALTVLPGAADVTNAVEAHRLDTTDVHGIPDTAALVTQTQLNTQVTALQLADGTRLVWRGAWAANTAYIANDLVLAPDGSVYRAPGNFVSGAVFNAANWVILVPAINPLTFTAMADPAVPAVDRLALYAKKIAGRMMTKVLTPTGVSYPLQPSFAAQIVYMLMTNTASSSTSFGVTQTLTGTGSGTANETLGIMTKVTSAASVGATAGVTTNSNVVRRGTVAGGSSGFFGVARWACEDASYEAARLFIGMTNATFSSMVTVDQPGSSNFGFQRIPGDANWFLSRGASGQGAGRTDTGMPFATGHVYEGYFFTPPGPATDIGWRLDDLTAGTTVEGVMSSALNPTAGTVMKFGFMVGAIDAAAHSISFNRFYMECDR